MKQILHLMLIGIIFITPLFGAGGGEITSFSPETGTTGTAIYIEGTGFTGVLSVTIGGTEATSFEVINTKIIRAIVPATISGSVAVLTDNGNPSLAGFTYADPISPVSTPPAVGDGTAGNPYQIANLENLYWLATIARFGLQVIILFKLQISMLLKPAFGLALSDFLL